MAKKQSAATIEREKKTREFVDYWKGRGYEKGESQPFWMALLRDVLGIEKPETYITFEDKVALDHTSFIDARIRKTHVLIEQKSIDKDLDAKIKQSTGKSVTPFQQAKNYSIELPYSDRPRWIVTSNFTEFRVYDMEHPSSEPETVLLENLTKEAHKLQFLIDEESGQVYKEKTMSLEAGELVGKIYDALKEQYHDPNSEESQHALNVLCVRLVFCLYAESAGIFGKYGMFGKYLRAHKDNARQALIELFKVLDTPEDQRDVYLDDDLAEFPYVNGKLFRGVLEIPKITHKIIDIILHEASGSFQWRDISPTIFGAIFESTLNPQTRRQGGMHYTSVENIHKVIDPLFLDDLKKELDKILEDHKSIRGRRPHLDAFRQKLSSLKFLDPACGSGNFLTETYLCLRELENKAIRALAKGGQIAWEAVDPIQVSIEQFYGIEINDFACSVAQTALWIAESQMLRKTEQILNMNIEYLPLTTSAHIRHDNALRFDWNELVSKDELSYIMGNPPFVGYTYQSLRQKEDLQIAFKGGSLKIDYVSAWFITAARYMQGSETRTAFVATNSITQGDQVAPIWEPVLHEGIHIDFAYSTFRWDNEANDKAHVHVVIIGFSNTPRKDNPKLLSERGVVQASNLNGYLVDGPNVLVATRQHPICDVPEMKSGNRPADGGALIIDGADYDAFVQAEPAAIPYIKRLVGAKDFIQGTKRWCLWLVGVSPETLRTMPHVLERIQKCKTNRENATDIGRRKLANTPSLFRETANPDSFVIVPRHTGESRRYVPFGLGTKDDIAHDSLVIIPSASLYHFGVLMSNVHMAWMRTVAGRLEMRYRYSKDIVYNNFPWPSPTPKQKAKIEQTAQAILDARALYPDSSLATLYDEVLMPPELRKAHEENDKAVMAAYGFKKRNRWLTEPEIVSKLMQMYADLIAKEEANKKK